MKPSLSHRLATREVPADRRPVMHQTWRHLAFLHWRWDAADLQAFLPPGLTVDTHEGEAWVGLVPFEMRDVRPRSLPALPWLSYFLELNLRTYVHDEHGTPGVWIFSLDCNQPAAVQIARSLFHLPYRRASMGAGTFGTGLWEFSSELPGNHGRFRLRARPGVTCPVPEPGSLEFFLVERYVLFAHNPVSERLYAGRVHHPPYTLTALTVDHLEETVFASNGFHSPLRPPDHVTSSPGVEVDIYSIRRSSSSASS
jgi:uncharacterized protein YqjF (DUF2071 family)